ncbi:MAG TPA: hypothetical protein VGC06_08115, partial [Actinomycetes bacterium]
HRLEPEPPAPAQRAGAGPPAPEREPAPARGPETGLFVPASDKGAHTGENGAQQQTDGHAG